MERKTKVKQIVASCYMGMAFESPKKLIGYISKTLKRSKLEFDTIAVRGMSGALIGPTLAYVLDKHLLVIRKDGENTHSSYKVEGNVNARKVLIVDDFVSTGDTVQHIIDKIETHVNQFSLRPEDTPPVEFVGIVGYRNHHLAYRQLFWLGNDRRIKLPIWGLAYPLDDQDELPMEIIKPEITFSEQRRPN